MKDSNRRHGFLNSETPLTSKKGRYVLSKPGQSKILIDAVRESRSSSGKFQGAKRIKFDAPVVKKISRMK